MLAFSRVIPYRRVLPALVALAANLFAVGVPVLHVLAHSGHAERRPALTAVVDHADHGHGQVHPDALHDEAAPKTPASPDGFFFEPASPVSLQASIRERREAPVAPPRRLASRAPPPGDPARAPPLA